MQRFVSLSRQLGRLDRDAFLERVQEPHLLLLSHLLITTAGVSRGATTSMFKQGLPRRTLDVHDLSLIPVRKREGANPFENLVTLGRARNNDVVIPDTRVSKLHTHFGRVGSSWSVYDASSSNGTWVDGVRVEPPDGMRLRSPCVLSLAGEVDLMFLLPDDLFDLIRSEQAGEVLPLPRLQTPG